MTDQSLSQLQNRVAALEAALARQAAAAEAVADCPVVVTDTNGQITGWNGHAETALGWSFMEAAGRSAADFITPENATSPLGQLLPGAAAPSPPQAGWLRRKDGSRFQALVAATPLHDDEGQPMGFAITVRDQSSQRRSSALREAEARLRRAHEAGGIGVFSISIDDGTLYGTPEFFRIYGVPEEDGIHSEVFQNLVLPEDASCMSTDCSRRKGDAPRDVEYRIRRADNNELRWIARKAEIEYDEHGKPVQFVGVARDITDRVAIQQQLNAERENLAQMFEQAPTFMAVLRGPDHCFERVNKGYLRLVEGRDVIGKTVREALPEAASQGYLSLLDEVFRTGETFSATGLRFAVQPSPGEPVHERFLDFVYQPLRDGDGKVTGIFVEGIDVTERTTASAALVESEERYRTLFKAIEFGFCIVEMRFDDSGRAVDYKIVEGNSAFERMTGLVGSTGKWVKEIAPQLEQHWFDLYGGVALTGEPIRFENPAASFGRWYDVQALRIGDPSLRRVAILFNDITDRKRIEARQAALLELSDALRDLKDPAEIGFTGARILGQTLGVSRAGYGIIDKIAETITIERDWNAPGIATIAGVLNFRDHGSYVEDLKRGETVAIKDAYEDPRTSDTADVLEKISARSFVNMPLVEQGRFVALFFANHALRRSWHPDDIFLMREIAERVRAASERVRLEEASRESEEQFRVFAEAVPSQIWASTPAGYLYWFNNQVYQYCGFPPGSSMSPKDWAGMVHPDDFKKASAAWAHALGSGEIYEAEFRIRRADGQYRWFLVRAEPVRASDGSIARWVGTNTDIHDRLRQAAELARLNETLEEQVAKRTRELMAAEEALRQSQKMEAVGQLTGGIAHDFNNLLTGISGSLELLSSRVSQGRYQDVDRYITAAQGASKRAAALTHRLLAFSRRQTLDPRPTDTNRLVSGMEELIRRTVGPQVEVEVVAAGGLWSTLVDPNQLENALLNLCINARDAMPDGGRLTIETGNRWLDARAARERDLEPGQYVSLCVSDTGTGMSPDVMAKAFDPFFTTKPLGLGTGLGLSMIYGFARQSGGQVRIYSEVGQGSMVCIYLPRHLGDAEHAEPMTEAPQAAPAAAGETVLVVDDEPTVRMLVVEILEELGYAAIEAADGPAGLKILQSDIRIDLLVTDVGLPGGMNGRQMTDAARLSRPDLKVLFITGYAENAVVGNGHLEPGMHVMTKPFAMDALGTRIRELILSD